MRSLLALALACAACDDPGLVGPVPGGETPCTQSIVVDGGAAPALFGGDHVVAAADLARLGDGTFAAGVERWDGTTWSVGVVFTDPARPPLEWNLGAPPAGVTPPAANPRLAISPSGEPALTWRDPDGTLALGTRSARSRLARSSGGLEPAIAWADAATPAVAWVAADQLSLDSSLGPIATSARWDAMDAVAAPGGGLLVAGIGARRIAFFVAPAAGGAPMTVLDTASEAIAGPRFVHGASPPEIYYVGVIARLAKEQPYLLNAAAGAGPRPVASPVDDVPDALVEQVHTWALVGGELSWLALGKSPNPGTLVAGAAGVFVAQTQPLVMPAEGQAALAVVREGRLEVDFFGARMVCR